MTCSTCIHNVRDWRLCLHPESQASGFWRDPQDYACHTPAKDVPETNFGKIDADVELEQGELFP